MGLKVITVTSQPERAQPLLDSLKKFNWPHVLLTLPEWKGFGGKLIATYEYLKSDPDCTHFIFCDAHDVVALAGPEEFEQKTKNAFQMVLSCEKGCWPPSMQPFKSEYPDSDSHFKYINSGLYCARADFFIKLFEKYPPFYEIDDQLWLNLCFLFNKETILPDYYQEVFNSHSFISEGEYTYKNNRVQINGNQPIFIHGNGGGLPQQVYDLLK